MNRRWNIVYPASRNDNLRAVAILIIRDATADRTTGRARVHRTRQLVNLGNQQTHRDLMLLRTPLRSF